MVYAVVTGGGTSGHVIPAIAILESLVEAGHAPSELRYVGSRRGVERSLLAESSVAGEYLPISGLQRSLSPKSIARNAVLPVRLLRSRLMARTLMKKWQPKVVVSVGGYASEPMAAAAIAAKIPLVCVSYDRTPGLATRRQARHAQVCAVAFADSDLPRAVHVGAPVRSELRHLDVSSRRITARTELHIPTDAVVVTIVGGSLGSGVLNDMVPSLLTSLAQSSITNIFVFHVAGTRNEGSFMPFVPEVGYRRVGYESRMADLYASTDVLIARAGASTIAEIATVGIAAVVVPWSGAADDHQTKNASWLADSDAALMCDESQCANGEVVSTVLQLVENEPMRREFAEKARQMGALHRSDALIRVIENAAF